MYVVKIPRSKYYQIVYFINGKRTTRSTKTTDEKEAQDFLIKFKHSLLEKPHPKTVSEFHVPIKSLSSFQKEYIEYMSPIKSPKYIESIKLSFNQFISFCGDISLEEINIRTIDKFITSTFSRTQRGAHHYFRTLKAAFNKAVEWNYISVNPFSKVRFPRLPKAHPAFLVEDELFIILSSTGESHLRDIFKVAFYTGLRLGELINMKWSWLDFFNRFISVKCSDDFLTKNKKERIVPMSDSVWLTLCNRFKYNSPAQNDYVFYRVPGKKLYPQVISKQFKRVVRELSLSEKIHFHSLRHSFASLLVQRGVSLSVVKELLGHEDLATTQIYSHLQQQNLREAINLM